MRRCLLATVVAVGALAACSASTSSGGAAGDTAEVTVFAASSLTAAFNQIGDDFEAANPGATVAFNFGSSTDLATQISSEGTADVFASASGTAMDAVEGDPGVEDRQDFVTNQLVIITPADDPGDVSSLADLAKPGLQLVLAAEGVPVGDYARQMLDEAGLTKGVATNVVSNEPDDAAVVAKVESGEADAGIVYTSDIASSDVNAVTIPDDQNVTATYPIAVVTGAPQPELAAVFVGYVVGTDGQATLERYGFGPPPSG
jgi:molybdate transport system substrate-binding protein